MLFIDKYSFLDRKNQTGYIINKYPDKIPVICEKNIYSKDTPELQNKKYLIPKSYTFGQFILVIRNQLKLPPNISLFFFIGVNIPSTNKNMYSLYECYKNDDGFLYVNYAVENTFG